MKTDDYTSNNNTNSYRQRMVIIALAVVIIILLILLIGSCNRTDDTYIPDIDPAAAEWGGGALTGQSSATAQPADSIQIPGYPYIYIKGNTTDVSISLLNPEGNPCYFTFQLWLTDTEELLYTSKQVPPGQAVTEVELARALEPGEYNAMICISTNSLTDGSTMNGANMITTLIVE